MSVWCVVLECPKCGKQRPFPISEPIKRVKDIEGTGVKARLMLSFAVHYVYCGNKSPSDELIEEVIRRAKLIRVPENIVKEVENRNREAKWDYYGLSQ